MQTNDIVMCMQRLIFISNFLLVEANKYAGTQVQHFLNSGTNVQLYVQKIHEVHCNVLTVFPILLVGTAHREPREEQSVESRTETNGGKCY
jgi:hypothetical protein